MHKPLFKINLRMFGIWDPTNTPDPSTNPLLQSMPEEAAPVAADPFMIEPEAPAAPEIPVEPPAAPAPVAEPPAPALDPDALVAKLMEAMKAQQPAAPEVTEPELTPEQVEERNTTMRDAFLDDPTSFLEEFKAKILDEAQAGFNQELAPYKQQVQQSQRASELQAQVDMFKQSTPDYDEYVSDMAQYLSEKPHLEDAPDALEIAYEAVKGRRAASNAPGTDGYTAQAANDPAVQAAVTKAYLQKIKDNQPPIVVKGTGNLGMPTTPDKPRSIKEATALLGQSMASKGY